MSYQNYIRFAWWKMETTYFISINTSTIKSLFKF